jgi:hypothetical protein
MKPQFFFRGLASRVGHERYKINIYFEKPDHTAEIKCVVYGSTQDDCVERAVEVLKVLNDWGE